VIKDREDVKKHWSFGRNKFPSKGKDRGVYRLFSVLRFHFPALSLETMKSISEGKSIYRNEVIRQINTCGQSLQERIVHLLEEHLEKDESICKAIVVIVRGLQFNPSMLEFCK
jgi:hypothetical protein